MARLGHPQRTRPDAERRAAGPRVRPQQSGRAVRITRAGWAFLIAVIASAAIWALFIAMVVVVARHHHLGQSL
jgi:hypothetical protein